MTDQKTYKAPDFNPQDFAQQVASFYQSQNFEVQVVDSPNGVMVQARAREFFKKSSVALTVTATLQDDLVTIQSGNAKWAMNAVSSVAALIVFWPLLGLTAYTSYKQKQLIDDTWQLVDRYMLSTGAVASLAPITAYVPSQTSAAVQKIQADEARIVCPFCKKPVRKESKFCDHCGKSLAPAPCPQCGTPLHPEVKFCDSCGKAL